MDIYGQVVRGTVLAFSVLLATAGSGALAADEGDLIVEGDWRSLSIPDPMTVSPAWAAASEPVAPEVPLGWRFRDIESHVLVGCSREDRFVGLNFDPARPKLPRTRAAAVEGGLGELVKLFGLDRLVKVRTRWDDVTKEMVLAREPGESHLMFVDQQEAIRLLKRARVFLVELPWETEETSYFRYSLTGSRAAIERVEQGCSGSAAPPTGRQGRGAVGASGSPPVSSVPEREGGGGAQTAGPRRDEAVESTRYTSQAEAGLATLPAEHQAWVRSSCPRASGPMLWTICVEGAVEALSGGEPDLSGLTPADRAWVRSSCPRASGPMLWTICVEGAVEALSGGEPDLSGLTPADRAWVRSSCPRASGPMLWTICVEGALEALRPGG